MRTLLISATLLALACAAPAAAQSYRDAISPSDRQDSRYDDRQAADPRSGPAYDGRGAAPGGGYGYQDSDPRQAAYGGQGASPQDGYRPAPRRHHRRKAAAVSRYTPSGRPVYYNDGMIRTGRDFPAGTVGGTR